MPGVEPAGRMQAQAGAASTAAAPTVSQLPVEPLSEKPALHVWHAQLPRAELVANAVHLPSGLAQAGHFLSAVRGP